MIQNDDLAIARLPGTSAHLNGAIKVFTRRGHDWTRRFRKIVTDVFEINAGQAIVDGEVVVPFGQWDHRLFSISEGVERPVNQDRAGRFRLALSQRPGLAGGPLFERKATAGARKLRLFEDRTIEIALSSLADAELIPAPK
jgi:hypothetical protein